MTVKELIAQLQMIENKNAQVIIDNMHLNFITYDMEQDEDDGKVFQYIWLFD